MCLRGTGPVGTAIADGRTARDERRLILDRLCLQDGAVHRNRIVTVDLLNMPTVRLKANHDIFRKSQFSGPVDADAVVIIQYNEFTEPEMPGQ